VCVHRGECVRVCMSVFDCTMFRKKKKIYYNLEIEQLYYYNLS
jgi:hypothetical protein